MNFVQTRQKICTANCKCTVVAGVCTPGCSVSASAVERIHLYKVTFKMGTSNTSFNQDTIHGPIYIEKSVELPLR